MKKHFSNLLSRPYTVVAIIIVILVAAYFAFGRNGGPKFEVARVTRGDVVERVSVTGKISTIDRADLALEKGGVVSAINFKVGDRVKKGDTIIALASASDAALLKSAEAKLEDLTRSLRPEEAGLEEAKVKTAKIALNNAADSYVNGIRSSYVKSQAAVVDNIDQFFNFPKSVNPTIKLTVPSVTEERAFNSDRLNITDLLNSWNKKLDTMSSADLIKYSYEFKSNMDEIKSFISKMSAFINTLDAKTSGMSQMEINSALTSATAALTGINDAVSTFTAAETQYANALSGYQEAQKTYELRDAGQSSQTIKAQQAIVDQYRAEYSKNFLKAPFDGVVTKIEPNLGEYVSSGQLAATVLSDGKFKIESNIPEADIAKIEIGNKAEITLDAYGDTVFPAEVVFIDPAETVIDGVATYKVTLHFSDSDSRVRSGMTANVSIETGRSNDVLMVPTRSLVEEKGEEFIRVLDSSGKKWSKAPVEAGLKGSDGMIEIKSGVKEGDNIVTSIK